MSGNLVQVGADRNWMHDPGFDEAAMAEFELRLARARPRSRPGYLRVKGATLLGLEQAAATTVAVALLTKVVTEYDDVLEVPWSHELLGSAYRGLGDLEQAERHLRLCIETADERRNGTTGSTEVLLGEVLLDRGRIEEAGEALASQDPRQLVWKSQAFRYAVAWARYEDRIGGEPGPWARQALEVAADREPQLRRDPSIGAVKADRSTLREMKRLARRT